MRKNRKGQIHNEFRLLVLDDDMNIKLVVVKGAIKVNNL